MRRRMIMTTIGLTIMTAAASLTLLAGSAPAHCDALNGPVAVHAREALPTGEFEPIAIWVGEDQTEELRRRFQQSLKVYRMDGEAQKLAERFFIENAVRLHRAAEGMPYKGVKPAQPLPPDIAAAEKALETGNLDPVTDMLAAELENQTNKWFQKALETKKHMDRSIAAGREYVDAYVKYVIHVHGLHQTIQSGPAHGVGE